MSSSDQVSRLFALVPYLQARPGVPIAEVARTFAISEAQVLADLQVLWMCGLPGGMPDDLIEIDMDAVEGEGVVHLTNADYLVRPLRFTRDEAVSLAVALNTISEVATGELQADATSAVAKLTAITGAAEPVLLAINTGDAELRQLLLDAIASRQRLRLVYDGQARGETTRPVVDAAGIEMRDGVTYLQAWSLDRGDWRTYRLDRIVSATPTGEAAADHGPAPELSQGWFADSAGQVTLELSPSASWVADYYPVRDVRQLRRGLRATFPVADAGWLTSLLLRLGAQVRKVTPPEAAAAALAAAQEALDLNAEVCDSLPPERASS